MTQSSGRQLSETEARVAKILQTALPGVQIVPIDPGGGPQQLHDFNLVDSAGSVEALEVTEATVASLRSASATRAKKLSSGAVPAPGLRRKWHLIPTEQTPLDQLDKAIPLLVQIESKIQADGLDSWTEHPEAQRLMTDFRLAYARPWGETSDPMLVVGRPADLTVWVENPGDPGYWVQQVVRDEANKDDNKRKLAASGAMERHLFIWVDVDYYLPWQDLDKERLPTTQPSLPAEVTTVWVATSAAGGRCVVWRVRPPDSWHVVPMTGPCS
jgi:hypothetical protein